MSTHQPGQESFHVSLVRPLINARKNSPFFLPLSLLAIASPLKEAGISVDIVDFEFDYRIGKIDLPNEENWRQVFLEKILSTNPVVVGITTLADTLPQSLLLGAAIRRARPNVNVVLGGPGVFSRIEKLQALYSHCFDFICKNEGEMPFLRLCQSLMNGEPVSVSGIAGKEGLCSSGTLSDLNILPRPAYELLPVDDYLKLSSPRVFDVYVGTGCTYACTFCITAPFWDRRFRVKAPETIMSELDFLYDSYGISQFNFIHDNFANNKKQLMLFLDYFQKHNTRYEWGCAVRPDNVDSDILKAMKRAGCFRVFVGADAGSERILKMVQKLPNSSKCYRFYRGCEEAGIEFEANTIIGYPDETNDEFEESLKLVFDAYAHGAISSDVSILQPLPGAPITELNVENLEFLEAPDNGSFCPEDAIAMARQNPTFFSGFYFIRKSNYSHAWYRQRVDIIRLFGREWFNTVYFLHLHMGFKYAQLLDEVAGGNEAMPLNDCFNAMVRRLEDEHPFGEVLRSVYGFDRALRSLRVQDTALEVENIYRASLISEANSHAIVTTEYRVDTLLGRQECINENPKKHRSVYLLSRSESRGIQVQLLNDWQDELLRAILSKADLKTVLDRLTERLCKSHERSLVDRTLCELIKKFEDASRQIANEFHYAD